MAITISHEDRSTLNGIITLIDIELEIDTDRAAALIQAIPDQQDEELAALLSNAEHAISDLYNDAEEAEDNASYAVECINRVINYRAVGAASPSSHHSTPSRTPIMNITNTAAIRTEETLAAIRKIVINTTLLGGDEANAFRLIEEIIAAADKVSKEAAKTAA